MNEIVKLCKDWGATDFDTTMRCAAEESRIEILKLCKDWVATDFDVAVCGGWLGYENIHADLFKYHHERKFSRKIHEEVLSIAWHPDRFWNWCVDEEEKRFLRDVEILSLSRDKLKSLSVEGGKRVINERATCERSCCEQIERFYVEMCGSDRACDVGMVSTERE